MPRRNSVDTSISSTDSDAAESFTFLYATDIHLGHQVENAIDEAKQDAFVAFDEILQLARKHGVDSLLLGGDLFHSPHPTMDDRLRCRDLLSKHVLGCEDENVEAGIDFQLISDPKKSFIDTMPNFENPDLNVTMPIISIYGNHDEPLADGCCVLQEFKEYINLIGRRSQDLNTNNSNIDVYPVVLAKGNLKVAIYGLSYIRPESVECVNLKFHKVYERNQQTQEKEEVQTFNICLIHQDRFRDSIGLFNRELIPEWMNVVLWGHEHQCRVHPDSPLDVEIFKDKQLQKTRNMDIIQPGAPIPTSLCEAESGEKYISKITVSLEENEVKVKYDAVELTSIRPFIFVKQSIPAGSDIRQNDILKTIHEELDAHDKPIFLRLRIQTEYIQSQLKRQALDVNSIWMKLDPKYQAKIANPRGFLRYTKKSVPQRYVNNILVNDAEENDDDAAEQLGNDIRSMIKTGTGKQEDFDEGEEKNVGDLMQDIADKLLLDNVENKFPCCVNPLEFLDSLSRAENIGAAEFQRQMVARLDVILGDSLKSFNDSMGHCTTEQFFTQQMQQTHHDDQDLDETAKQIETAITDQFLNQVSQKQVDFKTQLARRFHEKDEFEDPKKEAVVCAKTEAVTKKLRDVSVVDKRRSPKKAKQKVTVIDDSDDDFEIGSGDEEIIDASFKDVSSANVSKNKTTELSFANAVTSTQHPKRNKKSPPGKEPNSKRTKFNPPANPPPQASVRSSRRSSKESKTDTLDLDDVTENYMPPTENVENIPPKGSTSKKGSPQRAGRRLTQRKKYIDSDDDEFDFG